MNPHRHPGLALLFALLLLRVPASADDALREIVRAEAVAGSSEVVLAHRSGRSGSVEEKQPEGYGCTFRYETWIVDSLIDGKPVWRAGDSLRVFDGGQGQDCWRGHEYKTKGIDIGLILPWYLSSTKLEDRSPGARGILLGRIRGKRDFELHCPGSIERADQIDTVRTLARRPD